MWQQRVYICFDCLQSFPYVRPFTDSTTWPIRATEWWSNVRRLSCVRRITSAAATYLTCPTSRSVLEASCFTPIHSRPIHSLACKQYNHCSVSSLSLALDGNYINCFEWFTIKLEYQTIFHKDKSWILHRPHSVCSNPRVASRSPLVVVSHCFDKWSVFLQKKNVILQVFCSCTSIEIHIMVSTFHLQLNRFFCKRYYLENHAQPYSSKSIWPKTSSFHHHHQRLSLWR